MRYFRIVFLLFICSNSVAQLNLVPNPSFEDTVYCPFGLGQLDASVGWSSYRNSPDFYHACSPMYLNVPNANFGYQQANSGNAYIGLGTYYKRNSSNGGNYREYAGINLINPLQIGIKYYISFYAVLAERYTGFASNNLGLRFFTNSYTLLNPAPVDNISHLSFDSILVDSINWTRISGNFIADSNYQYLCIGNFYDFLNTDTLIITPAMTAAYYFVDDICVSTDSMYNQTWTGLQKIDENNIKIWPNPTSDFLLFQTLNVIDEIQIFDCSSRLVRSVKTNAREGKIDLRELVEGIYFASFRNEKTISVHKFLKL